MFVGHRNPPPRAPEAAPPPPPPALDLHERAEVGRVRQRLEPKWAALDTLLTDFRAGDAQLRRPFTRRSGDHPT